MGTMHIIQNYEGCRGKSTKSASSLGWEGPEVKGRKLVSRGPAPFNSKNYVHG